MLPRVKLALVATVKENDSSLPMLSVSVLPYFYYCSSVWHFCGARSTDKIEVLTKRILRFILGDFESAYYNLLDKVNCALLYNKRIHNMFILLYKSLFLTNYPIYMKNMCTLGSTCYNLRGYRNYILTLPKPKITTVALWPSFFFLSCRQSMELTAGLFSNCQF